MRFRTEYQSSRAPFTLTPERPVVLLGSCFSDNIAARMRGSLWRAENPLGTLYNPLSISLAVRTALGAEGDMRDSMFHSAGLSHSWLFDSRFSSASEEESMARIQEAGRRLDALLCNADALFVTFGTSWCYWLESRPAYLVANCHKQPASLFSRRRLDVAECARCWEELAGWLRERYPQLRIVFTVSPVRHMKDGFHGNALSKAVLLLAIERICGKLDSCSYFPAYEILNDDLRDYRYYDTDLVHPSAQGVEYIWEKFRETFLDADGEALLREGEKLRKASGHRQLIAGCGADVPGHELSDRWRGFSAAHPAMLRKEEI